MKFSLNIILILSLVIIFLIYNQRKCKEYFSENKSLEDLVKEKINEIYLVDLAAIRNLSLVSQKLQEGGYTIAGDIRVKGNATFDGNFNYLPRGTIVAFNGETAPNGWAICDGGTYDNYQTPDLRGRFIFGSGHGYKLGNKGGRDNVTLTTNEMPSHNHGSAGNHSHESVRKDNSSCSNFGERWHFMRTTQDGLKFGFGGAHSCSRTNENGTHTHDNAGDGNSFSIIPPYYVLTYIVKL
jgi:microcystin-dependent protein